MTHRTFTLRLSLIAALAATLIVGMATYAAPAMAAPACEEDEPCFVWSKMGNLNRGVVVRKSERKRQDCERTFKRGAIQVCVTDPCGFAYMWHRGIIDLKRTPRLRGDVWAMMHGCDLAYYG
jgi:hypothetical protein